MSDQPTSAGEPAEQPEKPHEPKHQQLLHWLLVAASMVSLREQLRETARNYAARAGLHGAAVLLWVAAAAFGLSAIAVWLATFVGLLAALAIMAGALTVIAIALHLIAGRFARRRRSWSWQTSISELNETLKNNNVDETAVGALMLAAVAGLLLGFRSGKH